jgi:hypothetical protein
MSLGPLAIFRGIFLGPVGCAGRFLRGFWGSEARGAFFSIFAFLAISRPTGLFCKKCQFFVFHTKFILRTGHFSTLFFHFGISPQKQKIAKSIFAKKHVF